MHGISSEEHIGRTVEEVVPFLADHIRSMVRHVVNTRSPLFDQELVSPTLINPQQVAHWSITWFPLHNAAGELLGVGAIVNDITARKLMEQSLRTSEASTQPSIPSSTCTFSQSNEG